MALIKCKECGKEISDSAKSCIHCGCKIKSQNNDLFDILSFVSSGIIILSLFLNYATGVLRFSSKYFSNSSNFAFKLIREKEGKIILVLAIIYIVITLFGKLAKRKKISSIINKLKMIIPIGITITLFQVINSLKETLSYNSGTSGYYNLQIGFYLICFFTAVLFVDSIIRLVKKG